MEIKPATSIDYNPTQSRSLLQFVIENDLNAIALLDRSLRYIYVSRRFLSDYHVIETDVLGKYHYEVFPDLPDSWKDVHQRALRGEVISADEDTFVRQDGQTDWVRWECRPWFDESGGIGGIILYTEVITKQKETELELIRAKEKAEESDRLKTAFLQNMSHEVRTPLNSIVGFSELLAEPGQSLQKIRSFSKIISMNSAKLIGIISDVIEIAQIQSKQVKIILSRFDVIPLLYRMAEPFREILQLKDIGFIINQSVGEQSVIESDKEKLEKIIHHLIDNAVKFTQNGSINVDIDLNDGDLHFKITDTGLGIPEDKQTIIFEPFRQLETGLSRSHGGTGVGLTIAKAYVDSLKGTISMTSQTGVGTTFYVTIPAATKAPDKPVQGPGEKSESIDTILIAEDEYSNFKYLYEVLHSDNLNILHANNGKEAIEICRNKDDIKMILMDIKMPVMDGTMAAKLIKEFRPRLPIIAQTAYIPEEEALTSVFDDLIAKPINRNDLKRKMRRYVNV